MTDYRQLADNILKHDMRPVFIDIEATGLDQKSYPIEIAYGGRVDQIVSFLIDPSGIEDWQHWSTAAQNIHHITPAMLRREGIAPITAMGHVATLFQLAPVVVSDNAPFDQTWLQELCHVTGGDKKVVQLSNVHLLVDALIVQAIPAALHDQDCRSEWQNQFQKDSCSRYAALGKNRHRAGPDVYAQIQAFNDFLQQLKGGAQRSPLPIAPNPLFPKL